MTAIEGPPTYPAPIHKMLFTILISQTWKGQKRRSFALFRPVSSPYYTLLPYRR